MSRHNESITPMSLRQRAGLTQFQAAVALGITPAAISKRETKGTADFDPEGVLTALGAYKCTPEELSEAFSNATVKLSLPQFFRLANFSKMELGNFIEFLKSQSA